MASNVSYGLKKKSDNVGPTFQGSLTSIGIVTLRYIKNYSGLRRRQRGINKPGRLPSPQSSMPSSSDCRYKGAGINFGVASYPGKR